ncbi:MAG: winged helix-turn-helix domain-containing tetratricopeptide repeat protein [Hyphomicrobiaceae bacterium]
MLYSFEDFALDTDTRELRRSGELLSVEPKVFDLLAHLIANRERVVSKDDLIASVWHGRIVSESALTTCLNAARTALGDNGETQRLIKTLPRKGLRFVGEVREQKAAGTAAANVAPASPKASLPLPDRPSLAVLPFINIGGDPEQDYFADGIVEEMITALSRMRWLFVIARNSSFTFKGRMVDVKEVGRELGVRYVLQGSVRKAAQRLRITAQLVDAATGTNLWADRFEGTLDDIFDLQDQVTTSVIAAISPQLERAEIARAKRKLTESLDAYDLYLHGMAAYHQWTREATDQALRDFYRAIELGPDLAAAYAMAAMAYSRRRGNGWVVDRKREVAEIRRLARQAVKLGPDDAVALGFSGFTLAHVAGELDDGAAFIDRALHLNPNLASALLASGWVKVWLGEPELAIEHLTQAMRLSPLDPFIHMMQIAISHAHFFAGRFAESASWAEKALREQPEAFPAVRIAAASLALSGRDGEARKAVARLLHLDAALRVSNFRETLGPYRHQEYVTQYGDALRKAGLPG